MESILAWRSLYSPYNRPDRMREWASTVGIRCPSPQCIGLQLVPRPPHPNKRMMSRWINPDGRAPAATLLIRLAVGAIFLSEGVQKFLFPDALGVGRFVKIGIPAPAVMAPFVGVVEIVCGTLVLVGLLTRLAAVPRTRSRPYAAAAS